MTDNDIAVYQDSNGVDVQLSPAVIRRVLTNGNGENVTVQEVKLFLELCRAQRLNPFLREVYLIKYGNQPATFVVGKDVFTKRAMRNPRFRGYQAGVVYTTANGDCKQREGSMVMPGETVVGGWCKVFIEGYENPMYDAVSFEEYAGRKKDGSLNSNWATKPATMIRKVAIVHALREAFPEDLGGLYDQSEMGVEDQPEQPIYAEPQTYAEPQYEVDEPDYKPDFVDAYIEEIVSNAHDVEEF